MLARFFEFVRRHSHYYWLHWNMRDINYGFAALSQGRYTARQHKSPSVVRLISHYRPVRVQRGRHAGLTVNCCPIRVAEGA